MLMEYLSLLCLVPGLIFFDIKVLLGCFAVGLLFQGSAIFYYRQKGTLQAFWERKAPAMAVGLLLVICLLTWYHFFKK